MKIQICSKHRILLTNKITEQSRFSFTPQEQVLHHNGTLFNFTNTLYQTRNNYFYVNHLDFAEVGRLQQFQHFQIIALDIEVLGDVKIDALGRTGAQSRRTATLRQPQAHPST